MRAALLAAALAARAEGRGLQQVSWEWHREGTDPTTVGCMTKASECGAWCQYDWNGNCDKEQCSGFLRCHPSPPPSPHVPPPPPPPPDETEALWDAIAALPTMVRPVWCTALDNRIDARRLPQPLWCQDLSQGECDQYFVHAPRTGDVPCIWRVSTGQCLPGEDCIDAADFDRLMHVPVSYTHLTLPTICSV